MRSRSAGTPELRAEIAVAVPLYAPIADLREGGDSFQYGGAHYPDATNFPTEDGRAHFALVKPPAPSERNGDGSLLLSTRRGKQFNSIVQESKDSITGATREAVMIAAADAERLGVAAGRRSCFAAQWANFAAGSTWRRSRPATHRFTGRRETC